MSLTCGIYKSRRKTDYYLFTNDAEGLNAVPEALLGQLGTCDKVMTLELTPDRRLAQADAAEVIQALSSQGYYLQLPPKNDTYMQVLRDRNEKL